MNYNLLPEGLRRGMRLYLEEGVEPGGFLRACLEDKLVDSFARADLENRARMFDICMFLYNVCPISARGSEKKVQAWIAAHERKREKARTE